MTQRVFIHLHTFLWYFAETIRRHFYLEEILLYIIVNLN